MTCRLCPIPLSRKHNLLLHLRRFPASLRSDNDLRSLDFVNLLPEKLAKTKKAINFVALFLLFQTTNIYVEIVRKGTMNGYGKILINILSETAG